MINELCLPTLSYSIQVDWDMTKKSYLNEKQQCVKFGKNKVSGGKPCNTGVVQGAVLSPLS